MVVELSGVKPLGAFLLSRIESLDAIRSSQASFVINVSEKYKRNLGLSNIL